MFEKCLHVILELVNSVWHPVRSQMREMNPPLPFNNRIFMYMCCAAPGYNTMQQLDFTSTEAVSKDGLFTPPFYRIALGQMKYYFPSTHYSWNSCEVKHGNSMWCSFELS